MGLESYRDVDSNFNNKVDQSRWLNLSGTRWGIDRNEDGKIDTWRSISAQESCRVAFDALVNDDAKLMQTVLLSSEDASALGLTPVVARQLLAGTSDPAAKIKAAKSRTKLLVPSTKWMRLDAASPSTIPADSGKASRDLTVYANAVAIVESNDDSLVLQVGEMIRVGDTWKLTSVPVPMDDKAVLSSGALMQPQQARMSAGPAMSEATQKLVKQLQKLDESAPKPGESRQALARYNQSRAQLIDQLIEESSTPSEREQWVRQLADGLAAAVQSGMYPEGLSRPEIDRKGYGQGQSSIQSDRLRDISKNAGGVFDSPANIQQRQTLGSAEVVEFAVAGIRPQLAQV